MAPTGVDIWRPLIQKLRRIARKPAGTVKPVCSGGRADSQDLMADIKWEGSPPQERETGPSHGMFRLDPSDIPPGSIELRLKLDGDKVMYSIHIHIGPLGRDHQAALYKPADTDRLESLVAHLRELAQWL